MPAVNARYYPEVALGRVFMGTTAVAGVKPPAYNATAHTFCLWNPAGSGKNFVPLRLNMGFADTTGAAAFQCSFASVNCATRAMRWPV